jgi:hypothetical protein
LPGPHEKYLNRIDQSGMYGILISLSVKRFSPAIWVN